MSRSGAMIAAAWALLGCGPGLPLRVQRQATRELHCEPPGLRVRAVGVLQSRGPSPVEVSVFDVEGCDLEHRYFCTPGKSGAARCAPALQSVTPKTTWAGLQRALSLLRTAARGRCPAETLRVEQESETLFVFEACDGRWPYHCRDRGCERLR